MILFIADLHLKKDKPKIISGFLRFLKSKALTSDALYILGDLFSFWIGDDDPNPLHRKIAQAIKTVVNTGVPCYLIHGNRDFLIGSRFAQESGLTLIKEEKVLDLYGRRILIMHGDTLCTSDNKYRIFRETIHVPLIQKLFLLLPLNIRSKIANLIQTKSKKSNKKKSYGKMDINQKKIIEVIEKYQVQWIIYGHTHHPNVNKFIINDQLISCIVLGSWNHDKGSMVKVTKNNIELLYFPLDYI